MSATDEPDDSADPLPAAGYSDRECPMIAVMPEDLVRRHSITVEEYYLMAQVARPACLRWLARPHVLLEPPHRPRREVHGRRPLAHAMPLLRIADEH